MADPLSFTASIIAVLGAAEGISRTIAKVKNLRNVPDAFLALINEVSDLKVVLSEVRGYIDQDIQMQRISQDQLQHISILVGRATEKLLQLDSLIQYRLGKPASTSDQIKVSRREWLRSKEIVEEFRQCLQGIRLNIILQMVVINSSHQSRISLTIDEIHVISGQLQTNQNRSNDFTHQRLNEHSVLLNNILTGQTKTQHLLQLGVSSDEHISQTLISNEQSLSLSSTLRIKAYASRSEWTLCNPYCKCLCHYIRQWSSPTFSKNIIGAMSVGCTGNPVKARQRCNETTCSSHSVFRAYVYYLFPSWFLEKALKATLSSNCTGELRGSLTVRSIVSWDAEIFRLVNSNNAHGLQRLLSMGLASPNDSYDTGITALAHAVRGRKLRACEVLIKAGADPHLEGGNGVLSAFDSAWNFILRASPDETHSAEAFRMLFPGHDDHLEERRFSKLHKIILNMTSSNLEEELHLNRHRSILDVSDATGNTALMWAARKGDLKSLDSLAKAGADINKQNGHTQAALHLAAMYSNVACIDLLLKAGAVPNLTTTLLSTALHFAARQQDNKASIQCLVAAGADVNGRDQRGMTPLAVSALKNRSITAEALLNHGAEIDCSDFDGDTPLSDAVYYNAVDTIQLLLDRGAIYTRLHSCKRSLLHFAAASGEVLTINVLLLASLRGIDTEAVNKDDKTAWQVAQDRVTTPEGFLIKFQELLTDIRTRNAEELFQGGPPDVAEHDVNHRSTLLAHFPRNPISNHWALSLCIVSFIYIYMSIYISPWFLGAKHIITLIWEVAGPGDHM